MKVRQCDRCGITNTQPRPNNWGEVRTFNGLDEGAVSEFVRELCASCLHVIHDALRPPPMAPKEEP